MNDLMQMIQPKSEECDHIKFLIEEKDSEEEAFYEDLDGFEENGTQETRISPYTFCKAFPFHLMFDKDLMLTQCGNAIYRVLPLVRCFKTSNHIFSIINMSSAVKCFTFLFVLYGSFSLVPVSCRQCFLWSGLTSTSVFTASCPTSTRSLFCGAR